MSRSARTVIARATGATVAVSRLWPGRADRLIIAPHDLRTADATRAAEIYAGRFVFAGKIVTCHGRSIFDLEPPSEDWEVALLGFGWLRHLRAADTALTRANARSLVDDWISNPGRKRPLERRADVRDRAVDAVARLRRQGRRVFGGHHAHERRLGGPGGRAGGLAPHPRRADGAHAAYRLSASRSRPHHNHYRCRTARMTSLPRC